MTEAADGQGPITDGFTLEEQREMLQFEIVNARAGATQCKETFPDRPYIADHYSRRAITLEIALKVLCEVAVTGNAAGTMKSMHDGLVLRLREVMTHYGHEMTPRVWEALDALCAAEIKVGKPLEP